MRIAVVGASGLVGRHIAELLETQGHAVRRLHRSSAEYPVDLRSGEGLEGALADVEVVINAANEHPPRTPDAVLLDGTRRLLSASAAHHVCVSIVGIEQLAPYNSYYQAKVTQEQLVIASGRPHSIVRSTQFHEFLGAFAIKLAKRRLQLHSTALFAPIAAAEAAAVIARTAVGEPAAQTINVTGPEVLTVTQLRAGRGLWVPLPLGRKAGRALRAGALTHPSPDVRGVLTYAQWLAQAQARPWRPAPAR